MKKLLKIMLVLVVLVAAAAIVLTLFLDKGIKRAVEVVGPRLMQVDVRLDKVNLSLFSGRVELEGLYIGNPEGYQSDSAIELGSLVLAAQPRSILSDKMVIRSLNLNAPVVTLEGGLKENNLRTILDNLNESMEDLQTPGREDKDESDDAKRKLQVDELVVAGGKVHVWMSVLGSRATTIDLPEIRMTDLGRGPEGITTAELTDRLLRVILEKATVAAAGALAGSSPEEVAAELKRAGEEAADKVLDEAAKGVGDLLKRKN
jgi:uncharacterized protein involved in outer membrane biogenesis